MSIHTYLNRFTYVSYQNNNVTRYICNSIVQCYNGTTVDGSWRSYSSSTRSTITIGKKKKRVKSNDVSDDDDQHEVNIYDDGIRDENQDIRNQHIHKSVMMNEVLERMHLKPGQIYIDGTFGLGGHSLAMLEHCKDCYVIGIDRDKNVFEKTAPLRERYKDRLITMYGPFSKLKSILEANGMGDIKVDGVLYDFGCSSYQLDTADRGFSFRRELDGPLDMRMDTTGDQLTAEHIVNTYSINSLRNILYVYGEERHNKLIAEEIARSRQLKEIKTTNQLVDIVEKAVGGRSLAKSVSRVFRALRMVVNNELGEIFQGLKQAERILQPGGHLVAISFHSLEDRLTKRYLKSRCPSSKTSKKTPNGHLPTLEFDDGSDAVTPTDQEILENSRSKPALLRSARRTSSPFNDYNDSENDYLD